MDNKALLGLSGLSKIFSLLFESDITTFNSHEVIVIIKHLVLEGGDY